MHIDAIPLECLYEAFGHAVGFGTSYGRKAGHQAKQFREGDRSLDVTGAPVVSQTLDGLRRRTRSKAIFQCDEHQIANLLPGRSSGRGFPGNDFPAAGIDQEGDANRAPVPALEYQPRHFGNVFDARLATSSETHRKSRQSPPWPVVLWKRGTPVRSVFSGVRARTRFGESRSLWSSCP